MSNPKLGNIAKESTTTQGTGTYTLLGAFSTAFLTLVDACGSGNLVPYKVWDAIDHEFGWGVVTDGGGGSDTLTRATIIGSSNNGAAVNWGAGTRNVAVGPSAELLNHTFRTASHEFASDANVTLTAAEYFARAIVFTDSPSTLTAGRDVILPAYQLVWLIANQTAQTLTIKTAAGSGVAVAAGKSRWVRGDGTNIIEVVNEFGALTVGALAATAVNTDNVSLASAATVNIGAAAANSVTVTGTVTVTAFDTVKAGVFRFLTFSGILTLTHNATSLILPGGANITTAAGDSCVALSLGSGNWRIVHYQRADGTAITAPSPGPHLLTPVALTNQTFVDFTIPAGATYCQLVLSDASTNGTSNPLIQLGDAGGPENTGYDSTCVSIAAGVAASSSTAGFLALRTVAAGDSISGIVHLSRVNSSAKWAMSSSLKRTTGEIGVSAGSKTLSGDLTTIRLTTVNGTDQYDGGTVNAMWW